MGLKPIWLALALVAGCSTVEWTKPGATQQAIDTDIRACRTAAASLPTLPRPQTAPPASSISSPTGTDRDADSQMQQAQRVDACMRSRGYQLVRK